MKYFHCYFAFFGQPWALDPDKFATIAHALRRKSAGVEIPEVEIEAAVGQKRPGGYTVHGRGTAVIPIFGVIAHRAGALQQASGGVSAEVLGRQINEAVADSTVRKIVMQIDSPGGSVYGIQELADKIRGARDSKKVIAVADPVAASAAYWLAAQATECYVTPSGQVGSVGVIAEHVDTSERAKAKGVKTTLVTAGKYKGEGHPANPLGDEGVATIQKLVDHYYGEMVASVAKGRGVSEAKVRSDFGEGRMMTAAAAKDAGLVDGVATMETVMRRLGAELPRDAIAARARAVEVGLE